VTPDFARDAMPGPELHEALAKLRARGPVAPVAFGGRSAFVITRFETLLAAFADVEVFPPATLYQNSIAQIIGPNFQSMEGEQHRLFRKLATPAFRSRAVEHFASDAMPALAHEVIDGFSAESEVDLVGRLTRRFPFLVISRLLGVPREREDDFHRWAWEMLGAPGVARERSNRSAAEFTEYLRPVIAARRSEPRDDVISELLSSEVEGRRLDDDEVLGNIRLMFSAGATTTHDALGSLLHTLLTQGDWWERTVAEPEIRPGAIHELLRWETPVANLPRISAPRSVEFAGCTIEPGSFVLFSMAAANRDPDLYDDPDCFDPLRAIRDNLTFGRGERSCPGMHLARSGLATALAAMAERCPDLHLVGDPLASAPSGTTVRGPDRLPVRLC
jgi:cytochrome P450